MIRPIGSGKHARLVNPVVRARHPLAVAIASVLALSAWTAHAGTAPPLSQAWLAAQRNQQPTQPVGSAAASTGNLTAQTSQQLLQQSTVQQSLANLGRAAQAVAAQMAAQQSAQKAAQQLTSPVPNGLTPGGLVVAPGVASNPSLWQNASAPTQSVSNGQTTVQVKQTAQKAILTWSSFNVGSNTTLYFDQSGGNQTNGSNNNWIVLNRVEDPSGVPSQIFGQIKAEGTVYLLNHNGILFGAGSQVNTQSLLASSMDLFSSNISASNTQFLNGGIASGAPDLPILVNGNFNDGKNHDVVVQAGASITGGTQGFVLVAAPNVSNAGSIVDDQGEVILAAAAQLDNATAGSTSSPLSVIDAQPSSGPSYAGGTALNTGLLQSRRGTVEMDGYNVTQDGVALASTSVSYQGSIVLNAEDGWNGGYTRGGTLTLGPASVTTILPEEDGTSTTSTAAATTSFNQNDSVMTLSGETIDLQSNALVEAPSAQLSVTASVFNNDYANPMAGRVYIDSGATVDVSGLANVELPMSDLLVTIPLVGQNELANSPLLRDSFLYHTADLTIDSSQSGVDANGLSWVGTPILNISGYVDDIPRSVNQLMTNGGSINLSGQQVIVRSGATLNLDGGYVAYQAGWITTPNLIASNGRTYNIADADPNLTYTGFAGTYEVVDNRWGVTTDYSNPLLAGTTRWDNGFVVGGNGGALNISTGGILVLDGQITAQAYAGRNQVTQGSQPSGGTLGVSVGGATDASGSVSLLGILLEPSVATLDQIDANFNINTPWSEALSKQDPSASDEYDWQHWVPLSTDLVQAGGFSTVTLSSPSTETLELPGTVLAVQPGGAINITAGAITILGDLTAPAGSIALTTQGLGGVIDPLSSSGALLSQNITVGSTATLSTAGLWVNDTDATETTVVGDRYINGGTISLTADQSLNQVVSGNGVSTSIDETGSIILQSGSLLDVSSGGYVNNKGQLQLANGVPVGNAGNISLIDYASQGTYQFDDGTPPPASFNGASLVLNGILRGYGFSGGGTLSLQAIDVQIGGSKSDLALAGGLYLTPSFFSGQGFDNYSIASITDASIAAGTTVQVSRDNLLPNVAALLNAPTGSALFSDVASNGDALVSVGALAPYLRYVTRESSGAGLTLSAGYYLSYPENAGAPQSGPATYVGVSGLLSVGQGASINVDVGGVVGLSSYGTVDVDGSVIAPGGAINLANSENDKTNFVAIPEVLLGSGADLDASGVSLIDPLAAAVPGVDRGLGLATSYIPRTGDLLAGGSVSLLSPQGYVLTSQDSSINVSGSADVYDLPTEQATSMGGQITYVPTPVWSDGGSITLGAAAGLYADGYLQAHAGSPSAEGGSLQIAAATTANFYAAKPNAIILQQSGYFLPNSGLAEGMPAQPGTSDGIVHFALDRLDDSGISSLIIGKDLTVSDTDTGLNSVLTLVPVGIAGNVELSLGKSLELFSNTLTALPNGAQSLAGVSATGYNSGNGVVHLTAPYVEVAQVLGQNTAADPVAGDGTLDINADFVDLGGTINLQGWADTQISASNAIRFYAPTDLQYTNNVATAGVLLTTGNLTLQAAELYPVSNYFFAIDANASGLSNAAGQALSTTLTVLGNGAATAPLSAGGGVLLDADRIVQDGTIWVPSGQVILGVQDSATALASYGLGNTGLNLALPLTQSVTLGAGSLTSVSLDGETVPYGSTTDGQQWSYAGAPGEAVSALSQPPAKSITIAGADVALNSGATIDISGGGTLQASEWVPGTGGTVNVLTQYETSYANSTAGAQTAQYADGRAIYAIVPGYNTPVSAQDAAISSATNVGAGPAMGQSVYLSGIAGLPAGYYTLLPAAYATLPGAYRVVQNTSSSNAVLGQNAVLPDGTLSITGYFANALDGTHSSSNTTFLVQSAAVWQQYSQYTFTDANSYFSAQASSQGTVAPALPEDGGHLTLSASQQLQLGATLDDLPAGSGRPGEVDIAAQAIQVTGASSTPIDGYLQISADALSSLNAGSLLLGGTRQLTDSGYQINSIADSVVLSNDSADPLQGAEILLVTDGNPGSNGIVLQPGSYLAAVGAGSADTTPISLGVDANSSTGVAAVSGDGALLRVSQDGVAAVTRNDVSGASQGNLAIGAGATVQGGNSLIIDATGNTSVDPSAVFTAQNIQADANQITFVGDGRSASGGLVIGSATLSLFDQASQVTLNSRGAIDFVGDVSIDLPQTLDLNAASYASDGGNVSIKASTLGLGNAIATATPTATAGNGSLSLNANELDFSAGSSVMQGFATVTANASQGIVGQGVGAINFGAANVSFNTPILLAQSGASSSFTTTGSLNLNSLAGTALTDDNMGGSLSLSGGAITVATRLDALAGNLALSASSGDLTLAYGADLDAAGVNKTFYDVTTYAPGGDITLSAVQGSVNVNSGANIDVAGAALGGSAGSLTITAANQVSLDGTVQGGASSGYQGGYFTLSSGGALDLDQLAQLIQNAGISGGVAISSGAGNLLLSAGQSLTAQDVYLTANGGAGGFDPANGVVDIEGSVNVSGNAAGEIALYGRNGVTVNGSLMATSSVPGQMGGIVEIGTSGTPDGSLNTTYGYENVQPGNSGVIAFGPHAVVNVAGGSAGDGGIIGLRAPLLANGDVPLTVASGASITGASNTSLVPYAVWSTDDNSSDLAKHFDGLIDPAGWYTAGTGGTPQLVAGSWYDQSGTALTAPSTAAQLQSYLSSDYFVPDTANSAHQDFYGYAGGVAGTPGTLMSYVEQPGYTFGNRLDGIANLQISPGIELINADANVNGGNISVLTNWNLGVGVTATDGSIQLAYRYGADPSVSASGIAPTLTIRALHDVDVQASITDGFYQQNTGANLVLPVSAPSGGVNPLYAVDYGLYQQTIAYLEYGNSNYLGGYTLTDGTYFMWNGGYTYFYDDTDSFLESPSSFTNSSNLQYYQPVTAPLTNQTTAYYQNYNNYITDVGAGQPGTWSYAFNNGDYNGFLYYNAPTEVAPQISAYASYADYVQGYQNWLTSTYTSSVPVTSMETPPPLLAPLQTEANSSYAQYSTDYSTYITGFNNYYNYVSLNLGNGISSVLFYAPFVPEAASTVIPQAANNSPSNMPSLGNPASLASATLLGGSSSTYQLVAGANFASVDPLAVVHSTSAGNIDLNGHFAVQYTAGSGNGNTLELPTTIRTGTGSIDLVAAGDITWQDSTAPATVYAAGAPAAGTTAGTGVTASNSVSNGAGPDLLINDAVNPDGAGNVLLSAGGNIQGIEQVYDSTGSITGTAGSFIGQYWWPWMETGNVFNDAGQTIATSINFANFDQGVMSVGGNVTVNAGGNISDLSVSLPTTWYANAADTAVTTVGGGNLSVNAGGNILSGSYFVAAGSGSLKAGGLIGSDFTYTLPDGSVGPGGAALAGIAEPVSVLLAVQDGQLHLQARSGVDIADVLDPSYAAPLLLTPDEQSCSASSSIQASTVTGDLTLGSLPWESQVLGVTANSDLGVLPATLAFTTLNGDINLLTAGGLYPSATGNLSLLAGNAITFAQENYDLFSQAPSINAATPDAFGLIDADASVLPSALLPQGSQSQYYGDLSSLLYLDGSTSANISGYDAVLHQAGLHDADSTPVRIYALNGSINDGTLASNGSPIGEVLIEPDKPALLYAGQDIIDLSFIGQQTHASDITRIAAGGSIYDLQYNPAQLVSVNPLNLDYQLVPVIELGGVGTLDLQAGKNIGPFTSQTDLVNAGLGSAGTPTGVETIGNAINSFLPHDSADINLLFGVGPGIDTGNFLAQYLNNPAGESDFGSLVPDLISFMEQQQDGQAVYTGFAQDQLNVTLTAAQAESAFQLLPSYVQQQFAQQELFKMLAQVSVDYNDPSSTYYHQYARGYAAIASLFPSTLGYTDNGSGTGGLNGEAKTVDTGDLDIRSTTIQTQQGGNITILGPGGQALIGSVDAPPVITNSAGQVVAGPNSMGVLTLEQGNINIFTDRSLLLAQSRIFTEQGGNMVIWSSNGDINAGQGAKTVAVIPAPTYLCDPDAYCLVDAKGEVSGAGIATLQTIPGAATGDVYLVAPRGTVDAGDAGIRVSGNLVVAAAQVLNAVNIQVQGSKVGVPVAQTVNVGALTAAGAAAGAVTKVAQDMVQQQQNDALSKLPSIISVQVLGFGDSSTSIMGSGSGYDPDSPVQVLGAGHLSERRKQSLTLSERQNLTD